MTHALTDARPCRPRQLRTRSLFDRHVQVTVSTSRHLVAVDVDRKPAELTPALAEYAAEALAEGRADLNGMRAAPTADDALLALGDVEFFRTVNVGAWNVDCGPCRELYGSGHTFGPADCDLPTIEQARAAAVEHFARRHSVGT